MKKLLAFSLVALVAASPSFAATSSKPKSSTAKTAPKTHVVSAEVVSTDATGKTITIKDASGDKTVPVEGKAVASLSTVKAGDKVKLTCRDNEAGEHQAVTAIHKSTATASTKSKPKKTT
jgi:hypothetical protein